MDLLEKFSAVDNRDDVLLIHPLPPLQLKAAIQELAGGLIAIVLQELADVTQSLQVRRGAYRAAVNTKRSPDYGT